MISFEDCFDRFRVSAFRLETLPQYAAPAEEARIAAWRDGRPLPERSARTSPWLRRVADSAAAGRRWSRVHVVDEPLSEYVRFELVTYAESMQAGEEIRITPRAAHPELGRLHSDFWLFDATTEHPFAALMNYGPDGSYLGARVTARPGEIRICKAAMDLALRYSLPLAAWMKASSAA